MYSPTSVILPRWLGHARNPEGVTRLSPDRDGGTCRHSPLSARRVSRHLGCSCGRLVALSLARAKGTGGPLAGKGALPGASGGDPERGDATSLLSAGRLGLHGAGSYVATGTPPSGRPGNKPNPGSPTYIPMLSPPLLYLMQPTGSSQREHHSGYSTHSRDVAPQTIQLAGSGSGREEGAEDRGHP